MTGAWKGSDRRDALPANWPQLVAETMRRARGRCQWILPSGKRCPRSKPEWVLECDHRNGDREDHRQSNLQALCQAHHGAKSSREGNNARWGKKKITPRSEGRHPGAIG